MTSLRSLRLSKLRIGDDPKLVRYLLECIQNHQKLQYLNLNDCLLAPKHLVSITKHLPPTLNSLILSENSLPKPSVDKKEFMLNLKEFLQSSKYCLTLLDISNMFLGFESLVELVISELPPLLLSVDLSGNHLSS
jgi:hypothetical protein